MNVQMTVTAKIAKINPKHNMKHLFSSAIPEVVAFLVLFFAPIQEAIFAVGFLIMADTFTGIWASWKKGGVESITSRKAGRIITKLILYPTAIIVAKVAENYLAPDLPLIKITTGIVATVEVKSIYEKISMLLGFNLWDKVKKAIWKDKEVDDESTS